MKKWFANCRTAEDCKARYHELVKKYHPDNGGSGQEIKEIISQFKEVWRRLKDIHYSSEKQEYYKAETETTETAEGFIDIISKLSRLEGVIIEMCGSWLWLSGNTYPFRQELKEWGCRWSTGKKKWYYTFDPWKPTRFHKSMNEIRRDYGSAIVRTKKQFCLE